MKHMIAIGLVMLGGTLVGCSTMIKKSTTSAHVRTAPSGAKFTIYRNGKEVRSGVAPEIVTLQKRGKYTIKIELPGYETLEAKIHKDIGWYYNGHPLFGGYPLLGGSIGAIIVHPVTGALYTFPEKSTSFVLQKKLSAQNKEEGIAIMDMTDIPKELQGELIPLKK